MKLAVDGENKFGFNSDVDILNDADIWDGGVVGQTPTYVFPTAARIHNLASTSVADDVAGTGALTVEVQGLDEDYLPISETVIMTGAVDAPTTNSYLRINRMIVKTAGSGGANAGTITATAVTDATITSQITIGKNQTLQTIFTVPATADFFLKYWHGFIGKLTAGSADFTLLVRPVGEVFQTKDSGTATRNGTGSFGNPKDPAIVIPAKADVKIRVSVGTDAMQLGGGFDGDFSRPSVA